MKTACEFGLNRFICPEFGGLCPRKLEEKSEFYSKNGATGGLIGQKVLSKKLGKGYQEHMSKIGAMGGRGNTKEKRGLIEQHPESIRDTENQ
ncbi:hypothetical protein M0R72_12930 [Candidatus Pacearchaeota archaeon]|jgi:hypothetical protein|nr:hypothetical protein [Candidatus Pacearchaeota archaeon]